jgi:hypothetical protein
MLDLGELDLSSPAEHVFQVGALPKADRWIIGLEVDPLPERPTSVTISDVVVQIEMTRLDGSPVLGEAGPLRSWLWQMSAGAEEGIGPAFVYSAGQPGTAESMRARARGTMFQPTADAEYRLVVKITRPEAEAGYFAVRLKAIGASEIGSL